MKVRKYLVLGAIAIGSCTIISCGKNGNKEEALRGRSVPGVQGVSLSVIPEDMIVEARNLIAEVEKEFERLGTIKESEARQEGDVNKVISERYLSSKYSQEVIKVAREEVEGYEEGVKKELLRKVLERLKKNCEERGKEREIIFGEIEDDFSKNPKKEDMKFGFEGGKSPLDRGPEEIYRGHERRLEELRQEQAELIAIALDDSLWTSDIEKRARYLEQEIRSLLMLGNIAYAREEE